MPKYSYAPSGAVSEITFKKTEGGQNYAYLKASASATNSKLNDIMCQAADHGWQVAPTHLGTQSVLQIAGFRRQNDVASWLQQHEYAVGTPTITEGPSEKPTFREQLKKRSLAASGVAYLAGDASFMKYGYEGHDPLNVAAGIMYFGGTASLLGFGRKDQSDLQIRDIATKLDAYMKENGKTLPASCSLDSIKAKKDQGLIKKADDLFRQYPSEMMNLFFAAAGACIMTSAYRAHVKPADAQKALHEAEDAAHQILARWNAEPTKYAKQLKESGGSFDHVLKQVQKNNHTEGWLDVGLGSLTGISGLFAMSVKEKKPDPDAPKKEGWEMLWEKIQSKPLAVAGIGYMVSTLCHAVSTGIAWQYASNSRRKSVPWRATFVASNLVAELLLAISSKGHGEGVKSDGNVDSTIISLAAEQISKQPIAMQEGLIDYVVGFLGRPDVLALKNDEARERLTHEVELMRNNPWAHAADKGTTAPQLAAGITKKVDVPTWQRKVATPPTAAESHLSI